MGRVNRERQGALFPLGARGPFAGVVLVRPVDQVLAYRVPEHLRAGLQPGARVQVPLGSGNAPVVAYCVEVTDQLSETIDPARIKDLLDVLDDPPLIDETMLRLTRWLADYYVCSWGQALDAAVPSGVKKASGNPIRLYLTVPEEAYASLPEARLTDRQRAVVELVWRSTEPLTVEDACRLARAGPGVVNTLRRRGIVRAVRRRSVLAPPAEPTDDSEPHPAPVLTADQARALRPIEEAIDRGGFAPFLLFGVTGSGKTEIYQSAIDRVIAQGREAIVLVPEISLTPQTIRRFRARFDQVAVLHSHMTDAERHRHWRSIAAGEAKVVVGARSAVFAPARNLGLIVVDEEHEPSFKQEITPRYQGRDAAVKRASLLGIPVILGSATPSLESWRNAQLGRYHLLELDRRVAERPMPDVSIVDLRLEPPPPPGTAAWGLSRPLSLAIDSALADDGQVMLLLNRRGYHRFVLCPSCGEVLTCPSCDVAMTHHRERRRVVCHMCETERALPESCRNCGQARLYFGGLGTERLEREVRSAFPDRVVRRMDSDTMRTRGSHERVLREFREGKIDILLGTQMIAKGLDFPDVTLVGVVDADTALHLPDFRAAERTFQLVAQVAGRAGRGHRPGRVIVQTYSPEQAAIRFAAAHDYRGFASEELVRRQQHAVPPFSRLARILARGRDAVATENALQTLVDQLTRAAPRSVRILGPAIAPIARIRNQHRFHAQLQAPDPKPLHDVLCKVWPEFDPPSDVEISIDIDPVQML